MSTFELETTPEWEDRVLCPDDSCIGVLDADGRCKVCGRGGTIAPVPAACEAEKAELDTPAYADRDAPSLDEDFAERELCSDEGCIGLIGPDGACKLCGKRVPSRKTT